MRIDLIILAVLIGLTGLTWATRPTPYESYNDAITKCLVIKDEKQKETCMVAVNSAYTRMLNKETK